MFFTYLRRELTKRNKQTILISSGMAVAIALVLLVSGLSNGIKTAQASALSGLYGVGTDISISKTNTSAPGPQRFEVGGDDNAIGTTRTFSRSNLRTTPGSATMTSAEVSAVASESGVKSAVATLKLESTTFNGELPTFTAGQQPTQPAQPQPNPTATAGTSTDSNGSTSSNKGGFDGMGGSRFDISRFSVEGVPTDNNSVGPLASTEITDGRAFTADDSSALVAVVDATYAAGQSLAVGDNLTIASKTFEIVGIAKSIAATSSTPSNVYIPLTVAQTLSSNTDAVTNIYVSATDSGQISALKAAFKADVDGATISSQDDLASSVSGSLGTASSLSRDMGGWLSAIVLLAAFLTAILFTTSGVNRRTREFGTLKAIGWRSNRIVRQVVGESLVNGLLGGVFGIGLGLAGVWLINAFGPTLSASVAQAAGAFGGRGGPGGGLGYPPGMQQQATDNAMSIQLTASIEPYMFVLAIAFALLGGLLAGAFGGLRAARLSPAEALRSVA